MPYTLSKITIISTAEGEQNALNDDDDTAKWDLTINQNNDVYLFIDKDENATKDAVIEALTIQNIEVTKYPEKGEIKVFMPSSLDGRTFAYDSEFLVTEKLEYKGAAVSNPKTLEIGSQGGYAIIRFSNTNIGSYTSNEDEEIVHNGTLLTKIGVAQEQIQAKVKFDLILQISEIKYKASITINIPCDGICEEGTTTTEVADASQFVFKRIK